VLSNIAGMNQKIREMETGANNPANDLRDQRDRLVRDLSKLIDIHYYDDQYGMLTVRGPGEAVLVDRGKASTVEARKNLENKGHYDLFTIDPEGGTPINITSYVKGGSLNAYLDVRDSVLTQLISENNELAFTFSKNFNDIHRRGYGVGEYTGLNGRDFFNSNITRENAAQNLRLSEEIENSVNAISTASVADSPGDNMNVNSLLDLREEKLFSGNSSTITDYYANFVSILGVEAKRAANILESDKVLMTDLEGRRESIAGVSLDEEATDMLKWQTAFTASSKIITTVNEMLETVLNLKR
jgi:flagellar hook-associated protein 1 FlgK